MIRFDPNNEGGGGEPPEKTPESFKFLKPLPEDEDEYETLAFVRMDGFDDCIIGVCHQYDRPPVIAYDLGKVISTLMRDGMTESEAVEFFEYNQLGAYVGPLTPIFVNTEPDCLPDVVS